VEEWGHGIMTLFSRRKGTSPIESFANFDVEFSGYENTGGTEKVRVRVLDSPVKGQGPDTFETVEFESGLRERARKLETRDLNLEGMTQLGSDLAKILLPGAVRNFYDESLASLEPNQGLRIRLRMGTWALATLPWEYTYVRPRGAPEKERVSAGFLALNRRLSLVRYEIVQGAKQSLDPVNENCLRVVTLTAQPHGSADLALENETKLVEEAVDEVDGIRLDTLMHATWNDFQSALDESVHIVHFAGHGRFDIEMGADYGTLEGQGSLLFETEAGEEDPRSAQDVALNLNNTGVRFVVLSACEGGRVDGVRAWSGIAPALARSGVPAVLAMQFRVRDDKAVAFSRRFYENLAAGGSIDTATTAGRLAMFDSKSEYGRDWGAPVLYLNANEGRLIPKPEASATKRKLTGRFVANALLGLSLFSLGAIYFLLHLEPLLSGMYLVGGASLAAVLSLFLVALDKFFGTVIVDTLLEWFGKKGATLWLAILCAVLFTLNFFTNSIFLIPGEDSTPYVVHVVAPDLSLERSWEVETTTEGEIFHFNNWRATAVNVNLGASACFDEIERSLYPFATLRLRVPDDFRHRFTLLRLIPGKGIWTEFQAGKDVDLRITVNGLQELIVPNPERSVLVFGDIDRKVDCRLKQIASQLEDRLRAHLESGQISAAMHGSWIGAWSNPLAKSGLLLQAQDQVHVEVFENETVIFTQELSTDSCAEGVCDIFMEVH
jgi:hypothetical protein